MTTEIEGQAGKAPEAQPQPLKETQKEPIKGVRDGFQKGAKLIEEMELGKSETAKGTPEPTPEEECRTCDKEKGKPYRVLKIQGKEYPFYSKEEYDAAASMGIDYTKKRQTDAEDRKRWEADYKTKDENLTQRAREIQALADEIKGKGVVRPDQSEKEISGPVEELPPITEFYKRAGLDEETASDSEKMMIGELHAEKKLRLEQGNVLKSMADITSLILVHNQFQQLKAAIPLAKQKYPIKDILDENGKSVTWSQFETLMKTKNKDEIENKKPIETLVEDSFREIHLQQQSAKQDASAEVGINPQMTLEEFKEKYPELYGRIAVTEGERAKVDYAQKMTEVPPSIGSGKSETDLRPRKEPGKKLKGIREYLDAGLEDPEIKKGLFGSA